MRIGLFALAAAVAPLAPANAQDENRVIWSHVVAQAEDAETLVIEGVDDAGRFRPVTIGRPVPDAAARSPLAPMGANLLELLDLRVFGAEERVRVHRGGTGVNLECSPGAHPAGVVLRGSQTRFPRNMAASLVLTGEVDARWGVSVVQRGRDAPALAQLAWQGGEARLPADFLTGEEEIVLTCPAWRSIARIESLTIEPSRTPGPLVVGTWQWQDADWADQPADFATRLHEAGLHEVALQVRITDNGVAAPQALSYLMEALGELGIAAHFVEGDPSMATQAGLPEALRRTRLLRDVARAMRREQRPLELDIEPYALPSYGLDPAVGWARWSDAVLALAEAWGGSVIVDVPWWMIGAPGGEAALERVRPVLESVVVMAYRTDVARLVEASEPWLSWGTAGKLPVRIALESGPVADEVQRTYRRAAEGELHYFAIDGQVKLQLQPAAPPAGAIAFRLERESRVAASRVSFCGDHRRRQEVQDAALPILTAWPAFAGLRIHGLLADPQAPGCR